MCPARSASGSRPKTRKSRPASRCCSSIPAPKWFGNPCARCILIGQKEDLPAVNPYVRGAEGMPPQIQQQATLTAREISAREAAN